VSGTGAQAKTDAQHNSELPITRRQLARREVSLEWLDALLAAASDVSATASVDEAVRQLLGGVADVFPDVALGACITDGERGQIVVRRSNRSSYGGASTPAQLFAEYTVERVVALPLEDGSTLHAASDDPDLVAEGGAWDGMLDRLGAAITAAVRHARAHDLARREQDTVRGLQAQVIQSEKLASLGQIAAGIVHELNNPLTSIVAYSDYLRKKGEKSGADPADLERLARINEAAERILRFSRDLIAYSRPSTEVPAPVAIHDVIDRALVFCEHVLEKTGVRVDRSFGEVRAVRGVAGQLTQVFVNLFTNASQAMDAEGGCLAITTTTSDDGATILIRISDEGHGIDADHLPRIFEPFFTTRTDGTGTGLGLSIVRNIVVRHGGRIRAEAGTPRGTVFYIELPIAAGS
jgi:signal transduction histidine kinase